MRITGGTRQRRTDLPPGVPARKRRRGSITVELLLNLPIWMIMIVAVVQFGELSCKTQYVSLASSVGAQTAAETLALPLSGGVPRNIVEAVQRQLAASHMACQRIVLEHNLGPKPTVLTSGNGPGMPPPIPLPSQGRFVRLTVFVEPGAILPNMLGAIGVEAWSRALVQSTTLRYRLPAVEVQP